MKKWMCRGVEAKPYSWKKKQKTEIPSALCPIDKQA